MLHSKKREEGEEPRKLPDFLNSRLQLVEKGAIKAVRLGVRGHTTVDEAVHVDVDMVHDNFSPVGKPESLSTA